MVTTQDVTFIYSPRTPVVAIVTSEDNQSYNILLISGNLYSLSWF